MPNPPKTKASPNSKKTLKSKKTASTKPKTPKNPKTKPKKQEENLHPEKEVLQKTLDKINKLGNQTFAYSPFNQYFDDWLLNLRAALSDFESDPNIKLDEEYSKNRSKILEDAQQDLSQKRIRELELEKSAQALSQNRLLLTQIDAEYSTKDREIGLKRNTEIERLTRDIRLLEKELDSVAQMRTSFFSPFSKRIKTQKQDEVNQKLNTKRNELTISMQNLRLEQETLGTEHAKRKETLLQEIEKLEKEQETSEIDPSLNLRINTCNSLTTALSTLIQKQNAQTPQKSAKTQT
jgi:hypothetical protein